MAAAAGAKYRMKQGRLIAGCVLGGLISALIVLLGPFHWGNTLDGRNDFRAFYAGGKLDGAHLYDPEATYRLQDAVETPWGTEEPGARRALVFVRMPWMALAFRPLSRLPYIPAYYLWLAVSIAAFVLFGLFWPGEWRIKGPVLCCCLPAWRGIFSGQDITLVLLWFGLALCLWRKGRPFTAGLAMALCGAKFHAMGLVPLVAIAQKRWRFGAGVAAGAAALIGLSFAAGGLDWPRRYFHILSDPRINAAFYRMPTLHVLAHGSIALEVLLVGLVAVAVWRGAYRSDSFEWALALAAAGGVLTGIHGDMQDCTLLLPLILLILQSRPYPLELGAIALASPVPWFWLMWPAPFPEACRIAILGTVVWAGFTGFASGSRRAPQPETRRYGRDGKEYWNCRGWGQGSGACDRPVHG